MPSLFGQVHKAFEGIKPKTVTTLTVKTEPAKSEVGAQKYPKIPLTEKAEEAVENILETDWGKWRPRTLEELKAALQANGLNLSGRLASILNGLVRKAKIRRWNTNAGFVYILAQEEALKPREDSD